MKPKTRDSLRQSDRAASKRRETRVALALCLLLSAFCFLPTGLPSAFCSQSGGSGKTTMACSGFAPTPCAPTSRAVRATLTPLPTNTDGLWRDDGPPVNQPWIDAFGEREVRVTDANIPGGLYFGDGWNGDKNWWTNLWSVYDSSFGGYYFALYSQAEYWYLYQFNPATMTATNVCPGGWTNCQMPHVGSWSYVTPGLMYYTDGSQICSWNYDSESGSGTCADGAGTLVYSFSASCSGWSLELPIQSIYDVLPNYNDTAFVGESGGNFQVSEYDKASGKCFWINTQTGVVGGTDIPSGVANSGPFATAPTMPASALTATTGTGSVPSGTYYVKETSVVSNACENSSFSTVECETTPSNEESVTLSATGEISIAAPTLSNGIIAPSSGQGGCNVYAGTTSGGETKQLDMQSCIEAITLTTYTTTGAALPTVNQGGFNLHNSFPNVLGNWLEMVSTSQHNNGVFWWNVFGSTGTETTDLYFCALAGACGGHNLGGAASTFYAAQSPSTEMSSVAYQFDVRTGNYSNLTSSAPTTSLHPGGPPWYNSYSYAQYDCNTGDEHPYWQYDNSADSMPVAVTWIQDSTPPNSFSIEKINCAWDHEFDMVAPDGSGTTWRMAHVRTDTRANDVSEPSTDYPAETLPACSPDGKYCFLTEDWNLALGTQAGNTSFGASFCATQCAWTESHAYSSNQEIIDSNGNEEIATTGGTTGSSAPSWPATAGATVTDGTVTWTMEPGCNTPASQEVTGTNGGVTTNKGLCRTDVFVVEMK
jgi:hypothetical protein